jgi:dipeptidyl aminopeptidase/acylaminoacyl peptidase
VDDIVRIRDVGGQDGESIALSPSGTLIAFSLQHGEPETNVVCTSIVLVETSNGNATVIDNGGDPIVKVREFRGKVGFPMGPLQTSSPKWSPDGAWFGYLKKHAGRVQLWIAGAGVTPRQISHTPWDVRDFVVVSPDKIVISGQPALAQRESDIQREGLGGYHFDGRFSPMTSTTPFPPAPVEMEYFVLGPETGTLRPAAVEEQEFAIRQRDEAIAFGATGHRTATRFSTDPVRALYRIRIDSGKTSQQCPGEQCQGRVSRPWWSEDGRLVYFLRQEGWANRTTSLYAWDATQTSIKRLFSTDAVISNCGDAGAAGICLREDAATPAQVVRLDYATGRHRTIFDPNPQLTNLRMSSAKVWRSTNAFGLQCYGHLVLPLGYRKGSRYPMVVIGYSDRGFLRGGTGDEYPVQAFASAGFAVLTYNSPEMLGMARGGKTFTEILHANLEGDAERKSIVSCVDSGVEQAVSAGVADERRIGLTGFSDGVSTAQYVLINREWVAAAALSHGTWEPNFAMAVGVSAERELVNFGYPSFSDAANPFWQRNSLRRNVDRVVAPILLQVSAAEFSSALEGYTALSSAGRPIEMFVFPGEYHVKWQPAHRLAIYRRAIDWFSYWLMPGWTAPPDRKSEREKWDTLRNQPSADIGRPVLPSGRTTPRPQAE